MKYIPEIKSPIHAPWYIRGEHTYGEPEVMNYCAPAHLIIGDYCSIADGVKILLGGHHHTEFVSTFPFTLRRPFHDKIKTKGYPGTKGNVVIGNDVFIGREAIIVSGVTIGDGAVIGAGAVVSEKVMSYAVVAGNPARFKKWRFTREQIGELLKIQWWNWPEEKVIKYGALLQSGSIEDFIKEATNGTD